MDELPPAAAAGWYPGPDGRQRYWDGSAWLQIPPPPDVLTQASPPIEPPSRRGGDHRRRVVAGVIVALVLFGLVGGVTAIKSSREAQQVAAAAAQDAEAKQAQETRAKAQADAAETARQRSEADKARKAQAAKEEKAQEQKIEKVIRKAEVKEIEKSVKTMARSHVKTGLIDGPVVDVSCDPVAGGSVDDLSEKTTVFQCFVANKKNKDGTQSGYYYNATINWKSTRYTYGYGKP